MSWVKISQAAKIVPFSVYAIQAAVRRGTLSSKKVDGIYYVDPDEVRRWADDPDRHPLNVKVPDGYMSVRDAAEASYFSIASIQHALYRGDLAGIQIGKRRFVKKESLEKWVKEY